MTYSIAIEGEIPEGSRATEQSLVDQLRATLVAPFGVTSASFDSDELGTVSLLPPPDLDTARARLAAAFKGINSTVSGYGELAAAVTDVNAAVEAADLAHGCQVPPDPGPAPDPTPGDTGTAAPAGEHPDQTAAQTAPPAL